jgi:hypothetical protein
MFQKVNIFSNEIRSPSTGIKYTKIILVSEISSVVIFLSKMNKIPYDIMQVINELTIDTKRMFAPLLMFLGIMIASSYLKLDIEAIMTEILVSVVIRPNSLGLYNRLKIGVDITLNT